MKKLLLFVIIILLIITIMNTDKIEYTYKVVPDDGNEELISLKCYKTTVLGKQILFLGSIYYAQISYDFIFVRWSDFPLSVTKRVNASRIEDSEYWYTPWIRINKNLEELYIQISMMNKSTGHSSGKTIKGLKIK